MSTLKLLAVAALALLLLLPGPATAKSTFTTIDYPHATFTAANALNPNGEIVGQFDDADGNTHGFTLVKGKFTQFDVPHAVVTTLNGDNASGELGGNYVASDGVPHAFIWRKGVLTTLDPPHALRSAGTVPNSQGQAVGTYRTCTSPANADLAHCTDPGSNFTRHGFLFSKGTYTKLDVPAAIDPATHESAVGMGTTVFGISEKGDIVGSYLQGFHDATGPDNFNHRYGFLLHQGVYTKLEVPGAVLTAAEQVNDAGQVVGFYVAGDGAHGFAWSKGVYTFPIDVPVPHASNTEIFSINASGQIVGQYDDADGVTHGFSWVLQH
jgi:uncharacterized membrane protein